MDPSRTAGKPFSKSWRTAGGPLEGFPNWICCFLRHVGFANLEQILKLLLKEPQIFRTEEKIEKEITNDIEPEPRGPSEPAENLKLAQNAAEYEQNQDNTSRE